jgi:capsular exopolysaccharide synthesis family protein
MLSGSKRGYRLMERIKQAVDKARENRKALHEVVTNPASFNPVDISDTGHEFPNGISYTRTRRIPVDFELLSRHRVIADIGDNSPISNAYKLLRTQVLRRMQQNNWTTIGVTSPAAGEGKTLTAVNLAISLAAEGNHTVLLVDFDLKYPGIASVFGHETLYGIGDYLYQSVPIPDILINPGIERLVVLPGKNPIKNSSETLVSPKVRQLVNELKSFYGSRIVIFDLPPLLGSDDVLAFSPEMDCALLVVEEGRTQQQDLVYAMQLLSTVNIIGTVLNKTSEKLKSY